MAIVRYCTLRGCRQRRGLRMAWKTAVGVLFVTTLVLGTYIKFFDHPSASETMDANRMIQEIDRPSFIKKVHQSGALRENISLKNETQTHNSSKGVLKITSSKSNSENIENETISSDEERVKEEDSEEVKNHDNEGALVKDGRGPHGIKLFNWENWVKENDFVNVGSLWGYCDDDDPPLIGKIILFNNDGTLSLTLVLNTTFGDKYYFKEQSLSRFLPSGTYSVETSLRNEYKNTIICGQCKFVI